MPSHDRRSVRLPGHAYDGGLYFVTVCTAGRQHLFGEVVDCEVHLSDLGQIAHAEWGQTGVVRPDVALDAFVVMPDHVHLLFGIIAGDDLGAGDDPRRGTARRAPTSMARRFASSTIGTVPTVVRAYKSAVTRATNLLRMTPGGLVWQRGYYDRVVRTDREADAIRRYVLENPARWHLRRADADGHRV